MNISQKINCLFTKKQKMQLVIVFIAQFIGAGVELLGIAVILPFVQIIMDANKIEQYEVLVWLRKLLGEPSDSIYSLILTILMIIIFILKNLYLSWLFMYRMQFTYNCQRDMSNNVMGSYLEKSYLEHTNLNTSEIQNAIMINVGQTFTLVQNLLELISELLVSMALCIYLFYTDPTITIVVAVLLGGCLLGLYSLSKNRLKWYGNLSQMYGKQRFKIISEAFGGIKEVKVLNREKYFNDSFKEAMAKQTSIYKRQAFISSVPKYALEVICVSGVLSIVSIKLYVGTDVATLLPQLSVFAMAAFRLLPSANRISSEIASISYSRSFMDSLCDTLLQENTNKKQAINHSLKYENYRKKADILINKLSFSYLEGERNIISNLSMTIPYGDSIAFIGESGGGKTTLADLILGILHPVEGNICYGDMDVHRYRGSWAEIVGYIPQSIFLCDDTIRRNIAFGIEDSLIEDQKVWHALEKAQLLEYVRATEKGLDTLVGESGVRISGGQRQRIGIARALYNDPEVLVLDEATSALDNDTEKAVMEAIDNLNGEKTMIIIAHRLSTIKNCQRIYVVKNGIVIEKNEENLSS